MTNIFVDPVIFTTPPEDADRDEVVAWLENLEIWLKEVKSAHFLWLHSENITLQLQGHGRLIGADTIRALANQYGLDINSKLLGRDIDTFLRNSEYDLESKLIELGYMLSGDPVIIDPEQMVTRWPEFIQRDMLDFLVTCSVCKDATHPLVDNLHIATSKLSIQYQEISVSAVIKDSQDELPYKAGDSITQTFPLLFTLEDLWSLIDIRAIWCKGEAGIIYLIDQYFKKEWSSEVPQPLKFAFGSPFLKSVEKCGLDTNETILLKIVVLAAATIAEQITSIASAKRHPVRINAAPDSPQKVRSNDQAKAWRLDFSDWRMHYWHIPGTDGDIIEFIRVEKEAEIKKRKKSKV